MKSILRSRRTRETSLSYLLGASLVVVAGLVTLRQTFGQTNRYIVTELSSDDAGQVPCKINSLGDIVGRKDSPLEGGPRATIWNRSRSNSKHLGALWDGDYSSASGINDAGEVVGVSNTGKGILPFVWTATAGLRNIPLLPGDSCGRANAINRHGHVAGYSSGPNGARAFLWTRKAGVLDLAVLPGSNSSTARDVNDSDEVAGVCASSAGKRAVLWTKTGTVSDLGVLPGDSESEAAAINNAGEVVGYSKGPAGMHAFLWTKATGMQDLGVLPGGNLSDALAINNSQEIVGTSSSALGDRAFIWTKQMGLVDLNNASSAHLGIVFIEAHSINSKGEILIMGKVNHGMASPDDDKQCAPAPPSSFVLTPVTSR